MKEATERPRATEEREAAPSDRRLDLWRPTRQGCFESAGKIEEMTGIRRGPTQVRNFLNSLGLRPRKVGMIPAKADVEEQDRFKKKNWSPDYRRHEIISGLCTS